MAALELALFEARCTGLTDLALEEVLFLDVLDLLSSAGGEGKLEPIVEFGCMERRIGCCEGDIRLCVNASVSV